MLLERALQGGGWGHRGYPASAVPAPNAAYITSSHCSQQSSQEGGQWDSKCGPAPPPIQFGAVPLTLLPLALWQPEPETHPRCLETSLGPQCPLGPTNPLFLCVLWENGEPPKQPMQIYAKEMQIQNVRVLHLKPVRALSVASLLPVLLDSSQFVSASVTVCVCEKVRNRNTEQKDRVEGPAGAMGCLFGALSLSERAGSELYSPSHRKP